MSSLPRLAVGPVQRDLDCRAVLWALLDVLDCMGLRVQSFLSRACLQESEAATTITGTAPRHLDSWLMTAEACRERFLRTARLSDLSVVEGDLTVPLSGQAPSREIGSRLSTLCQWLALPRLGIVDMPSLSGCQVPTRRPAVDALIIDRVAGPCEFYRWQTIIESLWGIPVLGGLDEAPALRAAIGQLGSGRQPPRDLCQRLGDQFLRYVRPTHLLQLANWHEWPGGPTRCNAGAEKPRSCGTPEPWENPAELTVAVAYDNAFFGYFPDALDALEQRGVTVRDFSPLHDEAIPADADIVYIGCGRPELHAPKLSDNHCLMMALRDHVCAGKRIYAEGGGLAYLCQQLALPNGERVPMAGIFPAVAHLNSEQSSPRPIELTLAGGRWLGKRNRRLRGYLNENWQLEPVGPLTSCAVEPERRLDLVERHQAVGSRVHFNFALQPALLESFLRPSPPALAWALPQ